LEERMKQVFHGPTLTNKRAEQRVTIIYKSASFVFTNLRCGPTPINATATAREKRKAFCP
jgi:hypothetical protein